MLHKNNAAQPTGPTNTAVAKQKNINLHQHPTMSSAAAQPSQQQVPSPPPPPPASSAKKRVVVVRRRALATNEDATSSSSPDDSQQQPSTLDEEAEQQQQPRKRIIRVVPKGSLTPGSGTAVLLKAQQSVGSRSLVTRDLGSNPTQETGNNSSSLLGGYEGPVTAHTVLGRPEDFVRRRTAEAAKLIASKMNTTASTPSAAAAAADINTPLSRGTVASRRDSHEFFFHIHMQAKFFIFFLF